MYNICISVRNKFAPTFHSISILTVEFDQEQDKKKLKIFLKFFGDLIIDADAMVLFGQAR